MNDKIIVKAGTSDTNPYKEHFDIVLADRRDQLMKYQDSILWSPRYTPQYFPYLDILPSFFYYLPSLSVGS